MEWNWLSDGSGIIAAGREDVYLVTQDRAEGAVTAARLTRYRGRQQPAAFAVAQEAAGNVIVFPMGRGPGRPGMDSEVPALMESAKAYAERFEAGEDLKGYPAWQQMRRWVAWGGFDADGCASC